MANDTDSLTYQITTQGNKEKLDAFAKAFENVGKNAFKSASSTDLLHTSLQGLTTISKEIRTSFIGMGSVMVGTALALNQFVSGSVKITDSLYNINQATGLSMQSLQAFANAGSAINSELSFDNVLSSITSLQNKLTDTKLGKGDFTSFIRLGINPLEEQNAFSVIEKLRDNIDSIPEAMRGNLLQQIGLNPAFLSLLKLTNKEFAKFKRLTLSNKERNNIQQLGVALRTLKTSFLSLKDKAVAEIAPSLTATLGKTLEWLIKNGDKVQSTLASIGNAFAILSSGIANAFSLIGDFVGKIIGTDNSLQALAGVIGVLAISFKPMFGALFLLIGLFDDIQRWRLGKSNVFGKLYENIDNLLTPIKQVASSFIEWYKGLDMVEKALVGVGVALVALQGFQWVKLIGNLSKLVGLVTSSPILLGIAGVGLAGYEAYKYFKKDKNINSENKEVENNTQNNILESKASPLQEYSNLSTFNNTNSQSSVSSNEKRTQTNNITVNVANSEKANTVLKDIISGTKEHEISYSSINGY